VSAAGDITNTLAEYIAFYSSKDLAKKKIEIAEEERTRAQDWTELILFLILQISYHLYYRYV